jgi:hypothetical protein
MSIIQFSIFHSASNHTSFVFLRTQLLIVLIVKRFINDFYQAKKRFMNDVCSNMQITLFFNIALNYLNLMKLYDYNDIFYIIRENTCFAIYKYQKFRT